MPIATSENGQAVFLVQDSAEWKAHTAQHGPMLAHSTVKGLKGRWVRTSEFTPLPQTEKYAPRPDSPLPTKPPDQAAKDRVDATMAALKHDLAAKNLAAFERQPLEPDPTIQGATSEERERAAALKRLDQLQASMHARPLPKIGQRS